MNSLNRVDKATNHSDSTKTSDRKSKTDNSTDRLHQCNLYGFDEIELSKVELKHLSFMTEAHRAETLLTDT